VKVIHHVKVSLNLWNKAFSKLSTVKQWNHCPESAIKGDYPFQVSTIRNLPQIFQ